MNYRVELTPAAERDLKSLSDRIRGQVIAALRALVDDPRPPGVVALRGYPTGNYRVRVGSFRVGYEVIDDSQTVKVWQIADRKHFYEKARRRR